MRVRSKAYFEDLLENSQYSGGNEQTVRNHLRIHQHSGLKAREMRERWLRTLTVEYMFSFEFASRVSTSASRCFCHLDQSSSER